MTVENPDPSGIDPVPPVVTPDPTDLPPKPGDHVAYETHRKLLGEKKAAAERARVAEARTAELEAEDKARTEKKLQDDGEHKKMLEIREKELAEARAKIAASDAQMADSRKLDAFLNTLEGKVDRKFWNHIDLEKVIIDPTTNEVDEMSVTKAVEQFKAEYPEIINIPGKGSGLPPESPKGGSVTPSSVDEWKKLPLKERKEKMAEVYKQSNIN